MLTPEDSKRVADALIEKIEASDFDFDIASVFRSLIVPHTRNQWEEDWFPLLIEEMCDKISSGITYAARDIATKHSNEI